MTGWTLLGVILLLLALLLSQSLVIRVEMDQDGFRASLGMGPFRKGLLPSCAGSPWEQEKAVRKERKAQRKKDKKAVKTPKKGGKKAEPSAPKKREPGDMANTVQLVLEAAKGAFPPLRKIVGGFRLTGLKLYIRVGGTDAAQTAIRYGQVCALVHGSLAVLQNFMHVRITEVGIGYDFVNSGITEEFSFKLKLRLSRALGQLLRMLWRVLRRTLRLLLKQTKNKPRPGDGDRLPSAPVKKQEA